VSVVVGQVSQYDLQIGLKVNFDDVIYVLSPMDTPLAGGIAADGLTVLSSAPVDEIQYTWMEEQILTPRSTLGGAVVTADVFITMATGTRTNFQTGDVIVIVKATGAGESMRVTGYGATADTLTVTRAYTGAATTYASASVVIGVGLALAEGAAPENARSKDRSTAFNYTQIFGPYKVSMSRTEQQVAKYGVSNEFSHQLFNRTQEAFIGREQAFLLGVRVNDTGNKWRSMGGIDSFIPAGTTDSASTQATLATIEALIQKNFNNGGLPDRGLFNPGQLSDLNLTADTQRVRQDVNDSMRGRMHTMTVATEYGVLPIVRNRWVPGPFGWLIKRDSIIRRILQPLILVPLSKTGDRDEMMLVMEEGLEVKGAAHMSRFTNLGYANIP
jgi:hypothetical protein